jgi:hypothetical protein
MNSDVVRNWKEVVAKYFKVPSLQSPGETAKNYGKLWRTTNQRLSKDSR